MDSGDRREHFCTFPHTHVHTSTALSSDVRTGAQWQDHKVRLRP